MVPFGGWDMPVQYAGIIEEHRAVRSAVGCFDVSHMGEFEVQGPDALAALQRLTTNDVSALEVGQVQYSLLCYEDGGIVDDLTLYRLAADRYMMTVNASNIDKDWAWVDRPPRGSAWRRGTRAEETALIAVQGPKAEALVGRLADVDVAAHRRTTASPRARGRRARAHLAHGLHGRGRLRALPAGRRAPSTSGSASGRRAARTASRPIGLGARDTLRLEMKYALYGNDIDETTNPLEAGLGWVVKPAKGEFIGRDGASRRVRAAGLRRAARRLRDGRARRRPHGYPILTDGAAVGVVTSGSYGPSVDRYIGIGYVPTALAAVGTALAVEIRGRGQAGPRRQDPVPSAARQALGEQSMATYPADLRYTREHEWAKVEGEARPRRHHRTTRRSSSATSSSSSCRRSAPR